MQNSRDRADHRVDARLVDSRVDEHAVDGAGFADGGAGVAGRGRRGDHEGLGEKTCGKRLPIFARECDRSFNHIKNYSLF